MRYEAEDAGDRRYTGVVTGMAELDPVRWPASKWRCLMVRWDDMEMNRHGRVSPWEIEPTGSFLSPSNIMASGLKRNRIGLPLTKPDFPIPGGVGVPDFGESLGFRKVLQGQEKSGSHSTSNGNDNPPRHHPPSEPRRCFPTSNSLGIPSIPIGGFGESFRFQKVLQGQETHLLASSSHSHHQRPHSRGGPIEIYEGVQVPVSTNGWLKAQVSSPSSVLMFEQAGFQARNFQPPLGQQPRVRTTGNMNCTGPNPPPMKPVDDSVPRGKASCRLFGFSLTEGEHGVERERKLGSFPPPVSLVEGYVVRDMLLDIAL